MFVVNFRIVDDMTKLQNMDSAFFDTDWRNISGFMEILFGQHKIGSYYHNNPIQKGEVGNELLNYWFEYLLDTINILPLTKYVAFRELDTVSHWIEFRLNGDNVLINVAIDEAQKNNNLFITEHFDGFTYVEPTNFTVEVLRFKNEIICTVNRFISEIKNINPELVKSKRVTELLNKLKS